MGKRSFKSRGRQIETSGKVHFFMIAFVRIMLILAFVGAFRTQRWLVLFVAVLAFVVTFLPKILRKHWGIKIPADYEVIIILFIYGSLFFGEVRGFYSEFWWWDILLNLGAAIALGLIGLTVLYVLYRDDRIDASPLVIAIFAFSFAVSIGALWEIFEFTIDQLFGFNMQGGDLIDTMKDMVVNAVGALIVSIAGYMYIKQGKKNIISKFIVSFIERNPSVFRKSEIESAADKVLELIKKGEGRRLEFKSTLRKNLHTGQIDRKVEHSVLKTVVAYLNSNGGTLLIGVSDRGEILGMKEDGFPNSDKLSLHLINLIKQRIGHEFLPFVEFEVVKIEEEEVLRVDCVRSDKQVFLKTENDEEFYVRSGPSTAKLIGSALIDYVERRFRKE